MGTIFQLSPPLTPTPDEQTEPSQSCRIVLIGPSQSGKSTFLEALQRYVDQDYKYDFTAIGNELHSCTTKVRKKTITTAIPTYEVFKNNESSRIVKHGKFLKATSWHHYQKRINKRDGLTMREKVASRDDSSFTIFDTPGLANTGPLDEKHAAMLHAKLQEVGRVHLVLITVHKNTTFTAEVDDAFKTYFEMNPICKAVIAFVHTEIDYTKLHPGEVEHIRELQARRENLERLLGQQAPDFLLDCDLKSKRPIRNCITNNTIRDILNLAKFNQPVVIPETDMVKTPKMKAVDGLLRDKYALMVKANELATLATQGKSTTILADIFKHEKDLLKNEEEQRQLEFFISTRDNENRVLVYEKRYDQQWERFRSPEGINWHHDGKGVSIHEVEIMSRHISKPWLQSGGQGHDFWTISCRCEDKRRRGMMHARVYSISREKHAVQITETRNRLLVLEVQRGKVREMLTRAREQSLHFRKQLKMQLEDRARFRLIEHWASQESLDKETELRLIEAKAYVGSHYDCINKVEGVYKDIISDGGGIQNFPIEWLSVLRSRGRRSRVHFLSRRAMSV